MIHVNLGHLLVAYSAVIQLLLGCWEGVWRLFRVFGLFGVAKEGHQLGCHLSKGLGFNGGLQTLPAVEVMLTLMFLMIF